MHPLLMSKTNPHLQPKSRISFLRRPTPPKTQQEKRLQLCDLGRLPVRIIDSPSPAIAHELGMVSILKSRIRERFISAEANANEQH